MKLIYLTNIQIPAEDAQSIQVREMSKAFYNKLGNDFLLISPWNNRKQKDNFPWLKIKAGKSRYLRYFLMIIKSLPIILKKKPKVIFSRDIGIIFFYKIIGFKVVYEIHKPFETKIGKLVFKIIAEKIKIISISQNLKDYLVKKYGIKKNNILVAHDGVNLDSFKIRDDKNKLREKLELEKDNFIVLYSGSFQKGKGIKTVIELAKRLNDISFVALGGNKKEIDSLRKKSTSNLKFLGRKNHELIPSYLKAADLLLLPLSNELYYWKYSSPLKLFEYMASGTPILASRIGALTEVLDENNCFLFESGNEKEIISKIKEIKVNKIEADKKSEKALLDVEKYSWVKRTEKIINFLNICVE